MAALPKRGLALLLAAAAVLAAHLQPAAGAAAGTGSTDSAQRSKRRGFAPIHTNGSLPAPDGGEPPKQGQHPVARRLGMENRGVWYTLWFMDGEVMTDPRVVIIYYGSGWRSNPEGIATINAFVQGLGESPWWLINRQYTSGDDRVGRNVILEDYTIDDVSPWTNVDGHENDIILDNFQSGRLSVSCKGCDRVALIVADVSTTNDGHCVEVRHGGGGVGAHHSGSGWIEARLATTLARCEGGIVACSTTPPPPRPPAPYFSLPCSTAAGTRTTATAGTATSGTPRGSATRRRATTRWATTRAWASAPPPPTATGGSTPWSPPSRTRSPRCVLRRAA